jgi:hypothetical protein
MSTLGGEVVAADADPPRTVDIVNANTVVSEARTETLHRSERGCVSYLVTGSPS